MAANTCIVCGLQPAKSKRTRLCGSPVCSRIKRMEIDREWDMERRQRKIHEFRARGMNLRLSSMVDRRRAKTLYTGYRQHGRDQIEALKATADVMRMKPAEVLFMLRADRDGKEKDEIHPEVIEEYRIARHQEKSDDAA